jgi:hypothetical protein
MVTMSDFSGYNRLKYDTDHLPPPGAVDENGKALPPLIKCIHSIVLNKLSPRTILPL